MKNCPRKATSARLVDCGICYDRNCFLLTNLQEENLSLNSNGVEEMRFSPGSILYNSGDPGEFLFYIREGLVKLVKFLPDGTRRIVRLLRRGKIAGLGGLLHQPHGHTAIVLQPTILCRIPFDVLYRLGDANSHLYWQLIKHWQHSLHDADEWLTELSTGCAKVRLARLLLSLLNESGDKCEVFTREDLGDILGITTETASRTVAEFKRKGVIKEDGLSHFTCKSKALQDIAMM